MLRGGVNYIRNASSILLFDILYVFAFIKIMYYECWNKQIELNHHPWWANPGYCLHWVMEWLRLVNFRPCFLACKCRLCHLCVHPSWIHGGYRGPGPQILTVVSTCIPIWKLVILAEMSKDGMKDSIESHGILEVKNYASPTWRNQIKYQFLLAKIVAYFPKSYLILPVPNIFTPQEKRVFDTEWWAIRICDFRPTDPVDFWLISGRSRSPRMIQVGKKAIKVTHWVAFP